jgi:hypothetical protein
MPFYTLKMIVLPRQARDKRRENSTERDACFLLSQVKPWEPLFVVDVCIDIFFCVDMVLQFFTAYSVRKTIVLSHLCINAIFLPRQARDKHRENTQKRLPFSQDKEEGTGNLETDYRKTARAYFKGWFFFDLVRRKKTPF